nr:hypothetical protein [Tanacetum cinerariifolium]
MNKSTTNHATRVDQNIRSDSDRVIELWEIDEFTKDLELGKYSVWSELTSDKRKEVLNNITTKWNAIVEDLETGESKPKPSKAKANFRPLFSDNLCKGANVSIPKKVVETNNDELQRFFLLSIQNFKRFGGCSREGDMDDS